MAAYRRVYDSRHLHRLTAKNRDQLRNPTLGNRVWVIPYSNTNLNRNTNPRFLRIPRVKFQLYTSMKLRLNKLTDFLFELVYQVSLALIDCD